MSRSLALRTCLVALSGCVVGYVGAPLLLGPRHAPAILAHQGPRAYTRLREVGDGFYNVRTPFKVLQGLVDVGSHMSLCRLPNGRYLAVDTVALDPTLKGEIDHLTDHGEKIEAVVATHPFHTLAFRAFHTEYPKPPYYGTPRHLRTLPDVPWAGDVRTVLSRWAPAVDMRIPDGAEFVDPKPESTNHFSNVFVLHRASRTVHNDDTVLYAHRPGWLLRLFGFGEGTMRFHPSLTGPGLLPTPEAPKQFERWVERLLTDWDFDNLCSAHNGCLVGGAKARLRATLEEARPTLAKIAARNAL